MFCSKHYRNNTVTCPALLASRATNALTLLALLVSIGFFYPPPANAATTADSGNTLVTVPLRLDYPLLQRLLVTQMFNGPQSSREVLIDPSGCSEVVLSAPALDSDESKLALLADVRARIGLGSTGNCVTMLAWTGKVGITGSPQIQDPGTALGFSPERVWLMNTAGQTVNNAQIQALAEASVRTIFKRFTVDLVPQLQSIGDFLPGVLPKHSQRQIESLLATLRVSRVQVAKETLDVDVAFAVEKLSAPLEPEHVLSEQELALWEERWQLMDSLLVLAVKHYASATQLPGLRDALLEVLIESRYRLRDALVQAPSTNEEEDMVREWFLQSWQALAPVIRQIGAEQPGQEHLLLVSVIAATDALEALDQLGPEVGLDISADGLRRLARMINGKAGDDLLKYSEDVDPELRKLFEESIAAPASASMLMNLPGALGAWRLNLSLFPEAVAADSSRLNSWAPQRQDLPEYLPLVAGVLKASTDKAVTKRKLATEYQQLFRHMVFTTAWQESCWRHYTVSKDQKLVPLRSGTGDVGLMQINERVWRGFYDQQRLRWDIDYNGEAGAEVLIDYLMKYAIRKGEHKQPGGLSNLARSSYSAYNGGPSKVARYRSSNASSYGKKVDAAFWEKYQKVAAGNELAVSTCLGGNMSGRAIAASTASSASAKSTSEKNAPAKSKPAENFFTLQLGVFSSADAARTFIRKNALGKTASVQLRRKGDTRQHLVIYGEYATRSQAERARKGLVKFQPWIRQFADL